MKNGKFLLTGLVAASVLLGGCAVGPTSNSHYYETVRIAPPPPYVEHVGSPPVYGHVWISGYWNWGGSRHVWVPGHWEAPRPGYRWVPHRWERDGDHWRQHEGRWEHAGGNSPAPQVSRQIQRQETLPQQRQESPRVFSRDGYRDDRRNGDVRNEVQARPMPERNLTQQRMQDTDRAQSPSAPSAEPKRLVERNEARPAVENKRRGDANERGKDRDERDRNDGRDRERGRERGNERERARGV